MSVRPLWLLDVDGVLNRLSDPERFDETGWTKWECKRIHGFKIRYSPQLIERINNIIFADVVDVMWCTTWHDLANSALAPQIGLSQLPVAPIALHEEAEEPAEWWKFDLASRLAKGRPTVWTDDDLLFDPRTTEWRRDWPHPLLAICPVTSLGLTVAHIEEIEDWLQKYGTP